MSSAFNCHHRFLKERRIPPVHGARPRACFVVSLIGCLLGVSPCAWAHREDFLDETLVYVTLEKGELEPEYWLDTGSKREADSTHHDGFFRHSVAVEYGVTDHWMLDARGSIRDARHEGITFESGRLETRYRFFEEGDKPIDIAVSAEANTERDAEGRQQPALEPRLILSKDFAQLNCTLNLPEEIFVRSGQLAFVPSVGLRYNATQLLRLGAELRYNTHSHDDAVVPQIWFAFPHDLTLKLGYSFGFNRNEESFGRMVIEMAL